MKRSSFSQQTKALPTASPLPCLHVGNAVAWPSRSAQNFRTGQMRPFGSTCVCVLACTASVLLLPPQSSHLTSQHTKVWPFPALQQEFLQRHINNSQSCFTLSSALGQKPAVKCGSIGQIFCVKKAKGLWTWQGFYLYFILFIESLVLHTDL